jgi:environmental stress-induced protein Ves
MSPVAIQADQVAAQAWRNGGGQTRELLAWPNASDWKLRISRADIASDGPFSAFAGVQRWFVVISGKGVVLHMPMSGPCPAAFRRRPGTRLQSDRWRNAGSQPDGTGWNGLHASR